MTHVNLDTQPETVQQFVLALAIPPEGVVLKSAGRWRVSCLPRPPSRKNPPPSGRRPGAR